MSKHLGNILEPIPLMDRHGADALRWFMLRRRLAVVGPPGRARGAGGDRPQGPADLLEHRVVPQPCTPAPAGWAPGAPVAERRRPAAAGPVGAVRAAPDGAPRWTRRWRASTPPGPASGWPRSSTTCPTGTCAGRGGGSGTATRPRWPPCTSACEVLTRLLAPFTPFVTEAVGTGAGRPGLAGPARLGAPARAGRAVDPDGRWSTRCWPSRSRWCGGWSSWAGRPGPRRRCGPGSRWAGRWSAAPGWAALPRRAAGPGRRRAQRAVGGGARVGRRRAGRRDREAELPCAGQAVRRRHQGGRGGGRGRRPGRARRRGPGRRHGDA